MASPKVPDSLKPLLTPVGELLPLEGNPRRGDVSRISKSLRRFGQRKPIVARKLDGTGARGEIIAGNHTYAAAVELGWDKIAVVFVDDDRWTARAFALADNRLGDIGSYDDALLADMLSDFASDMDMLEDIGWTPEEAALLLHDHAEDDEIPDSGDYFDDVEVEDKYRQQYGVIVMCDTEQDQAVVYERLLADGYKCKVVTT